MVLWNSLISHGWLTRFAKRAVPGIVGTMVLSHLFPVNSLSEKDWSHWDGRSQDPHIPQDQTGNLTIWTLFKFWLQLLYVLFLSDYDHANFVAEKIKQGKTINIKYWTISLRNNTTTTENCNISTQESAGSRGWSWPIGPNH